MADNTFLGTGLKFPLQIDMATGRFQTSSGTKSVRESLYLILMTQRTERLVRPDFGSDIMSYTFMDTGVTVMNILKRDLTQTILRQEPRISDVEINMEHRADQGLVIINIDYLVSATNSRDNLVFPFYLNADQEAQEEEPELYDMMEDAQPEDYGF